MLCPDAIEHQVNLAHTAATERADQFVARSGVRAFGNKMNALGALLLSGVTWRVPGPQFQRALREFGDELEARLALVQVLLHDQGPRRGELMSHILRNGVFVEAAHFAAGTLADSSVQRQRR